MLPIIGLIFGVILGLMLVPPDFAFSQSTYSSYVAVAILAALDSVFGGIAARVRDKFNLSVFISGFFGNAILAALLAYAGDLLGIQLYLAAIFAFGNRLFLNFAVIRIFLISKIMAGRQTDSVKDAANEEKQIVSRLQETEIFAAIDVQEKLPDDEDPGYDEDDELIKSSK